MYLKLKCVILLVSDLPRNASSHQCSLPRTAISELIRALWNDQSGIVELCRHISCRQGLYKHQLIAGKGKKLLDIYGRIPSPLCKLSFAKKNKKNTSGTLLSINWKKLLWSAHGKTIPSAAQNSHWGQPAATSAGLRRRREPKRQGFSWGKCLLFVQNASLNVFVGEGGEGDFTICTELNYVQDRGLGDCLFPNAAFWRSS